MEDKIIYNEKDFMNDFLKVGQFDDGSLMIEMSLDPKATKSGVAQWAPTATQVVALHAALGEFIKARKGMFGEG